MVCCVFRAISPYFACCFSPHGLVRPVPFPAPFPDRCVLLFSSHCCVLHPQDKQTSTHPVDCVVLFSLFAGAGDVVPPGVSCPHRWRHVCSRGSDQFLRRQPDRTVLFYLHRVLLRRHHPRAERCVSRLSPNACYCGRCHAAARRVSVLFPVRACVSSCRVLCAMCHSDHHHCHNPNPYLHMPTFPNVYFYSARTEPNAKARFICFVDMLVFTYRLVCACPLMVLLCSP